MHYSLGIIIPVIPVAIPRVRMHPQGMFYAALAAVMGLILNRMNVAITGTAAKLGSYFPSWEEMPVSIMLVVPPMETERAARQGELQPVKV